MERLASEVRRAREQQEPVRFTELDGRLALRIQRRDGVQRSFVTPAEREAIEAAVLSGPASFQLGDLRGVRSEASRSWEARDGRVHLSFLDLPEDPPALSTITNWARQYASLRSNEGQLLEQAALELDALAGTWSTTPSAIRAGLVLKAVTFSGTTMRALLGTGDTFAHHSVELELDASGRVVCAWLSG